jgi:large-conductance mechanosensitive channel
MWTCAFQLRFGVWRVTNNSGVIDVFQIFLSTTVQPNTTDGFNILVRSFQNTFTLLWVTNLFGPRNITIETWSLSLPSPQSPSLSTTPTEDNSTTPSANADVALIAALTSVGAAVVIATLIFLVVLLLKRKKKKHTQYEGIDKNNDQKAPQDTNKTSYQSIPS